MEQLEKNGKQIPLKWLNYHYSRTTDKHELHADIII